MSSWILISTRLSSLLKFLVMITANTSCSRYLIGSTWTKYQPNLTQKVALTGTTKIFVKIKKIGIEVQKRIEISRILEILFFTIFIIKH